jgi:hypothetical protein
MVNRPMRGRKSLLDQMRDNQKALDFMAAATGKPRVDLGVPEKRTRAAPKPSGIPLESVVLQAVLALVKRHPKVALAWRQNSGTFAEQNRDGSTRYIRANTAHGMSDIMGVLKDGRTLAIEVKRPGGKLEPHQQDFLGKITAAGGIAGLACSVEDAIALLDGA